MKKVENFYSALSNLNDIYNYEEPYYTMFCDLKEEIEKNWI